MTVKPGKKSKRESTAQPARKRASTKGAKTRAASMGDQPKAKAKAKAKPKAKARPKPTPTAKAAPTPAPQRVEAAESLSPATPAKSAASADHSVTTVAIFESTDASAQRAKEAFAALGATARLLTKDQLLAGALVAGAPADVVLLGDSVADSVRALLVETERPVVVLASAAQAGLPRAVLSAAGADLLAIRPHSKDSLAPVLIATDRLLQARQTVRALQASQDQLRERLLHYGQADADTGFVHFDFFKQMLVRELKRAKRYGYSLAVALIALDPWSDRSSPSDEVATTLRMRVSSAISACVRDIDLPVDFAEDRFLVFLPYTEIEGAERVGRRIVAASRASGSVEAGGTVHRLSVSVGIAASRPGRPVSFAQLIRHASTAVRAVQLKGGNGVVSRR